MKKYTKSWKDYNLKSINIDINFHKYLKALALSQDTTIKDLIAKKFNFKIK